MTNWRKNYKSKLCTADEAIKKIAGIQKLLP